MAVLELLQAIKSTGNEKHYEGALLQTVQEEVSTRVTLSAINSLAAGSICSLSARILNL
jgi:hypothetical protein